MNRGGNAVFGSVSCAPTGTCSASGGYTDSSGQSLAFVINQVNDTWERPRKSRHHRPQHWRRRQDQLNVVRPGGHLQRGGGYADIDALQQAFVVNKT